jgi:hypothetical protein
VVNPLAHISLENTIEETHHQPTIRRHKSTKELSSNSKLSDEHTKYPTPLPKSESTRRVEDTPKRSLGRSATTRGLTRNPTLSAANNGDSNNSSSTPTTTDGPLIDNTELPTFSKGSLLAKEEQPEQILYRQQQQDSLQRQQYEESSSNSNTLIQIDDRIKFAKGSLLDKKENGNNPVKMTRSKSVREVSSSSNNNPDESNSSAHRRHVSLRRKPTAGKKHHDVPLPNNAAIASLPVSPPPATPPSSMLNSNSNNKDTLLKLDDAPEKFHSRELHGRHVKPLLNFDSNERPTRK